jgi:nucleoside-diphosphate-sugar epimerase
MTRQREEIRSGRRGPVVAVTSAAGPTGAAVAEALARRVGEGGIPRTVVAIDDHRGPVDGVTWRLCDVATPAVAECLAGAEVVVHVAAPDDLASALTGPDRDRRGQTVRAVQAVATAAAAVGADRLVVVSSAMVYGALPDNEVPLPDDAPLRAVPDDGLVGDLLEVERVLERAPSVHPGLRVAIIRPAALVGPGIDTIVTRHFEAPRLLAVRGAQTRWQFCHVEDLARAVCTAVAAKLDGPLTVGAPGSLDMQQVEVLTGMRKVELPPGLALGTAERLHRVGLLPMPASDLSYVVHPWVVGADRLREAGWQAEHDNTACLTALLGELGGHRAVAGRRVERRDAALGAAGAAVALVGTAALVRQARSRQARRRRPTL